MENQKVFSMKFSKVYPLLVQKAERKGRTAQEVYAVTSWLTGYTETDILRLAQSEITYGQFFEEAPAFNPNAALIKGVVCGVRVETIEDPLMQRIRWLDKLVDELAKSKAMDKILRSV